MKISRKLKFFVIFVCFWSIQESNPSVASVLQMIIDAAKQVQGDDSYTQSDLEFATAFMQEVLKQAKEHPELTRDGSPIHSLTMADSRCEVCH